MPTPRVIQSISERGRRGNAVEHHRRHPLAVPLRVGERECRPPRAAEQHPALYVQVQSQTFDVGDQVGGRVGGQVDVRGARMGRAPAATALIEQDDAIDVRVEVAPRGRRAAGAWSAMEHERRLAGRVARGLPVEGTDRRPHRACRRRTGRWADRGRARQVIGRKVRSILRPRCVAYQARTVDYELLPLPVRRNESPY